MEQLKQRNKQRLKIRNKQLSNKSHSIHTHKNSINVKALMLFFLYKILPKYSE